MPHIVEIEKTSMWYFRRDGQTHGPYSSKQLKESARTGALRPESEVRQADSPHWYVAARIPGLEFSVLPEPTPKKTTAGFAIVVGICCMICVIAIGILIWFVAIRDTWEIENRQRITRAIAEAHRLRETDPFKAYKLYDAAIRETEGRVLHDTDLAEQLMEASRFHKTLYSKVRAQLDAEEKERLRLLAEEAKKAAREQELATREAERQRSAEQTRRAEEASRLAKEQRLREAALAYKNAPDSARTALNSLKRVQARTEVGVIYGDYSPAVGETWGEVKIFIESPQGKTLPEFNLLLASTAADYKLAMEIWSIKIRTTNPYLKFYEPDVDALQQRCWMRASARISLAQSLLDSDVTAETLRVVEESIRDEEDLVSEWRKLQDQIEKR